MTIETEMYDALCDLRNACKEFSAIQACQVFDGKLKAYLSHNHHQNARLQVENDILKRDLEQYKKSAEKVLKDRNSRIKQLDANNEHLRGFIKSVQEEKNHLQAQLDAANLALAGARDIATEAIDLGKSVDYHSESCPKSPGVLEPRCYEPCNCGTYEPWDNLLRRLSTLPNTAKAEPWQPIETAPEGCVTENAGCRGSSEWFLGLSTNQEIIEIQRLPDVEYGHDFKDRAETYYLISCFTHWKPKPAKAPDLTRIAACVKAACECIDIDGSRGFFATGTAGRFKRSAEALTTEDRAWVERVGGSDVTQTN